MMKCETEAADDKKNNIQVEDMWRRVGEEDNAHSPHGRGEQVSEVDGFQLASTRALCTPCGDCLGGNVDHHLTNCVHQKKDEGIE